MPANANNTGCLSLLFPFLNFLSEKKQEESLPYRLRDDFLSAAEFSFYKVLTLAVGKKYCIQSKVRLADIFFVAGKKNRMSYQNRINQKHLDFLICDSVTMKPLLGIELDDASHKRTKRRERDIFFESVFRASYFPLLRFPVKRMYDLQEIKAEIFPILSCYSGIFPAVSGSQPPDIPICPKCNIPMVLKTVTRGTRKGKQFYGCRNYPRCQEAKPL